MATLDDTGIKPQKVMVATQTSRPAIVKFRSLVVEVTGVLKDPYATQNEQVNMEFNLSSTGLLELRAILNNIVQHPGFYEAHIERHGAADLAFVTHGASLEDTRDLPDDGFHPSLLAFRKGTPDASHRAILALRLRRAIFDHSAAIDKVTGSTTFVVHIPGAMEPGSPPLPEYIKAFVYVPGSVISEIERDGKTNPVPNLVQAVIRELGVHTVQRFDRARQKLWNFPRKAALPKPKPLPVIRGMPDPIPLRSSRYLFYGQAVGGPLDPSLYFAPDLLELESAPSSRTMSTEGSPDTDLRGVD